jgi:pimeloyl-ACP methyl ester carboxylesterase
MLRYLKLVTGIVVLAALFVGFGAVVSADSDSQIFGLVYIDSNRNGVWDAGEEGYPGIWQDYWDPDKEEWVQHYLGTPITFSAGDEQNAITLRTAGAQDLGDDDAMCHCQDYLTADGPDDDDDMDVNAHPMRPCSGTYGLRPAGEDGTVWRVTLTAPDGYIVTSPNPVYYEVGKDTGPVDFGLAPISGTRELEGMLHGAAYTILVPEDWNGVLLLYAHGYTVEPVTDPEAAFLGDEAETRLLNEGYALAASGYRGTGWNVEEGLQDTKRLLSFFESQVGNPKHVILYGVSMGGTVALKSVEEYPNLYSAAVPLSISSVKTMDQEFDYALAYDVAFGWSESWGTVNDVRNDIEFYSDVWFAKVYEEVFTPNGGFNQANYPKWEFIRRVSGVPEGGYYSYTGPIDVPPAVVAKIYFMTQQRAQLEARAGGPIVQNFGRVYSLSEEDKVFLESLTPSIPVEAWLAEMNTRTDYRANPSARNYIEEYADFSGKIQVPVLMVHNIEDSIDSAANTIAYLEKVQAEGNENLLVRIYSERPGHCNFTIPQLLKIFDATVGWLESGTPPGSESFPAYLDFSPGFNLEL